MWIISKIIQQKPLKLFAGDFYCMILRLSVTLLIIIVGKLFHIRRKELTKYGVQSYWYFSIVIILISLILVGFLFFDVPSTMNNRQFLIQISVLILGVVLITNTVGIVTLMEKRKVDKERISLQDELLGLQKKYYAELIEKQNNLRKTKHDMKAHLMQIEILNQQNRKKELQEYLNELNNFSYRNYYSDLDTGNQTANVIINYFADLCNEKKIKFNYEGHFDLDIKVTKFEMCSLLYNAINNAYEECLRLPADELKEIQIGIKNFHKMLLLTINNTCRKSLQLYENKNIVTSKSDKENHGYGTKIMSSIVDNYKGEINYECRAGIWSLEMIFPEIYI